MNVIELRYALYKFLVERLTRHVDVAGLDSPEPGQPVTISVAAADDYSPTGGVRYYRITFEEVQAPDA
jgi:hypothetical protein